jgi:hypothetical protein
VLEVFHVRLHAGTLPNGVVQQAAGHSAAAGGCGLRCPGSAQLVDVSGDHEVGVRVGIDVEDSPVACADAGGACPQL